MMMLCNIYLSALIATLGLPPAVQRAVSTDHPWRTSHIEYTITTAEDAQSNSEHYILRSVGDSIWQTNLGNDKGRHERQYKEVLQWLAEHPELEQTEEMHDYKFAEPHHTLVYDDQIWYKMGSGISAKVRPTSFPSRGVPPDAIFDPLASGIAPLPARYFADLLEVPKGPPTSVWDRATYQVRENEPFQTITSEVEFRGQSYQLEWEIDPARGNTPVSSTLLLNGEVQYKSLTELQEIGGRWVPKQTQFFRHDFEEGSKPYRVIDVTNASFDEPWHPQEPFTPNDIGIALGHQLAVQGSRTLMYWDGTALLSKDDYDELINLYGVDPDPSVVARQAKWMRTTPEGYLKMLSDSRSLYRQRWEKEHGPFDIRLEGKSEQDPWDSYVQDFIEKNRLTGKAREFAQKTLRKAKRIRSFHQKRYRARIRTIDENGKAREKEAFDTIKNRIFKQVLVKNLRRLAPKETHASSP